MQPGDETPMLLTDDTTSQPTTQQTIPLVLTKWLPEIISVLVALAVLLEIVILLAVYDGHPNPLWSGGITLNAIISFASMVFRTSLMVPVASCLSQLSWVWLAQGRRQLFDVVRFDQASRGPYGSLKLLFWHPVQSYTFIGACVTILSLVIGPFPQQSMVFYSDLVIDSSTISYASYAFDCNASVGFLSPSHEGPALRTPFNMKSAIYNGIFSSVTTSPPVPPFSCPSGNCSWDPFPTLALNVQCRDAPEQYRLNCSEADYHGETFPERCMIVAAEEPAKKTHLIMFPTEVGSTTMHFAISYVGTVSDLNASLWTMPIGGRVDFEWVRATDLLIARNNESDSWQSYVARNSTIESRQCIFSTSLQSVTAYVVNGAYDEFITNDLVNATANDAKQVVNTTYTYAYTGYDGISWSMTLPEPQQEALLTDICIPFQDLKAARGSVLSFNRYANVSMSSDDELIGADIMKTLYYVPNLTETAHAIARHMTVALRSVQTSIDLQDDNLNNGDLPNDYIAPKHRVPGLVYINKIHVLVRWGWLALPAFLAALVCALLIATILISEKENVGVWKDSPLPLLLFSRWEGERKSDIGHAQTEKDIRRAAEGIRVELGNDIDESGSIQDRIEVKKLGAKSNKERAAESISGFSFSELLPYTSKSTNT
ncbi:hypothetical protein N0V83_007319 [Neocucurbitaria cava]|uniref:Uncharacterized protein n=1 Tax=Neocucurbitaria cava TaxID=798079 RepID=A0A9W8Y5N1_9PLEO|nr:hypothetical protein N0V83_007319 [Neocucurbitaria cava]